MKFLIVLCALILTALPARAEFAPSAVLFHPAGGRSTASLSSIGDISVIADLDSTLSASYAGSGTAWANIVSAPADGTSQSANNFGAYGTFTGTAGQASAYFLLGGSTNVGITAGNTAFLSGLQNDTGSWWIAMTFNLGANSLQTLWSSQNSSSTVGMTLTINGSATPRFSLTQYTTASKQIIGWSPTTVPAAGAEYIVILSHNAGGNTRLWFDTATNTIESATLFTAASLSASHAFLFGSRASSNYLSSGTHLSHLSYGTGYLGNSQAGEIIHLLESRHHIDYDGNGTIGN